VGLDLTLQIHDYILKHIERSTEPSSLLKKKVERGELGFKTGKGFHHWTQEDMKRVSENLSKYLIDYSHKELD
jgi:3-hydroxybutyryl-CoA dehydrogenase